MKHILELIEKREIEAIKICLYNSNEQVAPEFNWYTIAEKLSNKAFRFDTIDFEVAELAVEVYERIYAQDLNNEGPLMSSLYLRIRGLQLANKKVNSFLDPQPILDLIKLKLGDDVIEIKRLAKDWKSQSIEKIKGLRKIKNWITLLEDLEIATKETYKEFNGWKEIKHLLP